ncbi:MAG: NHLP bacteriocin export ABC transporter permease/ATPase subunit [Thermoanaerobaculia bacterium]
MSNASEPSMNRPVSGSPPDERAIDLAQLEPALGETVLTAPIRIDRLDATEGAWWIQDGSMEVFAQRWTGSSAGRRVHVATIGPGCVLLGLQAGRFGCSTVQAVSPPDLSLTAVGHPDTELRELSVPCLRKLGRSREASAHVARLVNAWIRRLPCKLLPETGPEIFEALEPGTQVSLPDAGWVARPYDGVVWVLLLEGLSCFVGRPTLRVETGDPPLPVSVEGWVTSAGGARLTCFDTAGLLHSGRLWEGLDRYHALFLSWLDLALVEVHQAEREQLRRTVELERHAVRRAHAGLASVLVTRSDNDLLWEDDPGADGGQTPARGHSKKPERACPETTEEVPASPAARLAIRETRRLEVDKAEQERDGLLEACRLVGTAQGLDFINPADPEEAIAPMHRLARIATASRIPHRRVLLRDGWWKQDNGPLVGFIDRKMGWPHAGPVALLPISATRYELVQPRTGERYRVDGTVAEHLQPEAIMFHPHLPEGPVGVRVLAAVALRGHAYDLATLLLMGAAGGLVALLLPLLTGHLFGTVIPSSDRSQLVQVTLALCLSAFAGAAFQVTRAIAVLRLSGRIDGTLQAAVWNRLMSLPVPFFRRYSAGDLADRALGLDTIRELLTGNVITSFIGGIFSFFSLALLFYYSWRLALLASLLMAILATGTLTCAYFQLRHQRGASRERGKVASLLLGFIHGIAKIRVAGAENRVYGLWAQGFRRQRASAIAARRLANLQAGWSAGHGLLSTGGLFAMVVLCESADLAASEFLAFFAAFGQFQGATLSILGLVPSLLTMVPTYERLKPILVTSPELDRAKPAVGELTGELVFSHVTFRYRPDGPKILEDVSFRARPGNFIALVGASGVGKSTCLRLSLGFERPEVGSIYFDGKNLESLDPTSLRRQIGVVLQESRPLAGNVLSNVIGSRNFTTEEAWEALRLVGLEEEIGALPMGLQTVISEDGTTFSGGQLQRILIARAIIHRPKILLFDEATNALDNAAQEHVTRSLEGLAATRVVVAHRLSTIRRADRIYVLDKGRVVEVGRFEELRASGGLFSRLARRQSL